MDITKEIKQLLNNHALPTNDGGFIRDTPDGTKFLRIAEDIVKLLHKHGIVRPASGLSDGGEPLPVEGWRKTT